MLSRHLLNNWNHNTKDIVINLARDIDTMHLSKDEEKITCIIGPNIFQIHVTVLK